MVEIPNVVVVIDAIEPSAMDDNRDSIDRNPIVVGSNIVIDTFVLGITMAIGTDSVTAPAI